MANHTQPPRYESSILAAGLAVAGTVFVSDKLSSLLQGALTYQMLLQATGILMIAAGICLLLVGWPARTPGRPADLRGRSDRSSS